MPGFESVPATEWRQWVDDHNAVILDVRQPVEWGEGTLPDSLLISMTELVDRVDEIPPDRAILCVCRSGSRSAQVAAYLVLRGHHRVANMTGGMKALGMQD